MGDAILQLSLIDRSQIVHNSSYCCDTTIIEGRLMSLTDPIKETLQTCKRLRSTGRQSENLCKVECQSFDFMALHTQ